MSRGEALQWCCWQAVSAYLDCSYAYWHLQICNQQKISWWIFEKHEISAFCTASCGRDPSVMQLTSSSSPPWFKSLLILLLHLQLWNLLIWKKLLSIVLHDLLRGPSMMLLTSCSSIPWLLMHMLSGTFRFSIYTIFHVWIQCIDYNDFLKNMIFHYFA